MRVSITLARGVASGLIVASNQFINHRSDMGMVASMPKGDQNSLRWIVSQIYRLELMKDDRVYVYEDDNAWKVCVSTINWPGRATYISGVLDGFNRRNNKKNLKRRLRKAFV